MNFTNDIYGLKACFVIFVLIAIGMVIWEFVGFDSGSGGTPFNLFE